MINKFKLLTATALFSLVSACGGGGGGDTAAPVASTEIFPLKAIYKSSYIAFVRKLYHQWDT
jgi:hypothetical protein